MIGDLSHDTAYVYIEWTSYYNAVGIITKVSIYPNYQYIRHKFNVFSNGCNSGIVSLKAAQLCVGVHNNDRVL